MKRYGILTSGGDCPGLNATIRGIAKAVYENDSDSVFYGIKDGYYGLIHGEYKEMKPKDFSGILNVGGTILGTSRQPHKLIKVIEEDQIDKMAQMKNTYKQLKLDCLFVLGGQGTHKTANLLAEEGLNIIALPKTIDNDLYGTDFTFGFHTAVSIGTDVIDRIHTTAASHRRVMIIEIMGNKVGWLTLYAGVAGGADIIILPEIPYSINSVVKTIKERDEKGKAFTIIAIAEGAISKEEATMKKKERASLWEEFNIPNTSNLLARQIEEISDYQTRVVIPGHYLRGGSPSAYDRILATQFGSYAASLAKKEVFGVSVALKENKITHNKLSDIAGITKFVPVDSQLIKVARKMGISFAE